MDSEYIVGFKDVYPWVWSVMLGVSLTLAERRGAFLPAGTHSASEYWAKNIAAVLLNLVLPALIFGFTMVRLGPLYCSNMDFYQILGALYLAGVPLGAHHAWKLVARKYGWMPPDQLTGEEIRSDRMLPFGSIVWAFLALGIPAIAALVGWRVPF